jgi:hypothetical protein
MIKKIILFSCVVLTVSCNNTATDTSNVTESQKDTVNSPATQPENELADFKFHTLIINIPSPFEIITLLPKSNIPFKQGLVNSTDNLTKYTTTTKKGLNYGVYVVDLVYLSSNEHFSEVKSYFKTAGTLAKSLGCAEIFENIAGPRLENNIDKKDTINIIIDQIYTEMDNYLRSNDRLLTATQILVGSWIESQYLTVGLIKDEAKNKDNELLFQKVAQEGYTLEKLVQLLKEFEKEKDFKPFIEDLKDLQNLYKEHKGGDIEKALLAKIYDKLSIIRGKVVN